MAKLELLASSPGTGKTTYCIDLFRREILKSPGGLDSRSYFVLPNREHAGRIQNLVLKKSVPGLFNVHILTIQDVAQRFSTAGLLPRPSESLRRSILRRILEDEKISWDYFSSVKDLAGFHALLSERLQEFIASTMGIEEFERRAQPLLKDGVFRAKFRDFCIILKRYEAELEAKGLAEAEHFVSTGPAAQLVILDGFYHFTQAQKVLILALSKRVERMVVTLTLPKLSKNRPHLFDLVESTRRFLHRAGFKASSKDFSKNYRVKDPALLHLEENLFLPEAKTFKPKQNAVRLLEAETPREEVECIAREILSLHRSTGWHFSDMAIILRSVQGYEKWIAPVFDEYGIPVFVHERKKTIQTGVGRFAHRLTGLFLSGWRGTDLLPLLKSHYLPMNLDPETAARFERLSYSKNIRQDRERWLELAKDPSLPGVDKALGFFSASQDALMSSSSARVFRSRFLELLRHCRFDRMEAETDKLSWAAIEGLLARLSKLYPDGQATDFSAKQALEEFQRALEVGLFSQRPRGKNRVQVYDAVMALPKEYRVVFVAGLLDQVFPKPVTEDPLFKDSERQTLNGKDARLQQMSTRHSGERYFFFMAVTRARNLLVMSFPKKDQDARAYLPSIFLEEVQRCFHFPLASASGGLWVAKAQAERALAEALFSSKDSTMMNKPEKERILTLARRWQADERFSSILKTGSRDVSGRLTDPRIIEALAAQTPVLSATRLESFLTCAFKYFAENTLRLKPYFEDRLRLDMGTLLHAVLERHYRDAASGEPADPSALLEKLFAESPLVNEPLYRQRFLLRRMKQTLQRFLNAERKSLDESGLVPTHFELEFGKKLDGHDAPWPFLTFGKEEVRVGGKIDRIDLTPEGNKALVIDYKLGTRNLKKKLKQGVEVQLPVYMLAVKRLLGLDILGAELRFIESGKKAVIDPAQTDDLLKETEQKIVEAAARMRRGDIAVHSKSCDFCDFDPVCRFQKWKLVYSEVDGA